MANKNPKQNYKFPKAPQGLDDKKSKAQVERARNNNLMLTARTLFDKAEILPDLVDNLKEQVQNGQNRDTLDFLKIIKEPEEKQIKINGGIETQKIFVTKAQEKEVNKHIDNIIGEQ